MKRGMRCAQPLRRTSQSVMRYSLIVVSCGKRCGKRIRHLLPGLQDRGPIVSDPFTVGLGPLLSLSAQAVGTSGTTLVDFPSTLLVQFNKVANPVDTISIFQSGCALRLSIPSPFLKLTVGQQSRQWVLISRPPLHFLVYIFPWKPLIKNWISTHTPLLRLELWPSGRIEYRE